MTRLGALCLAAALWTAPAAGAADVERVGGLLRWMDGHADKVGLVALTADGATAVSLNPRRSFPLASVRKVLTAGALMEARPPGLGGTVARRKIDRFYVPGTDLGNHERAGLDAPRLKVADIADGMIRYSSNAAADYLLARVGVDAVDRYAARHGMRDQDPAYSIFGEFASWANDRGWLETDAAERARRAERRAAFTSAEEIVLPSIARQRKLADVSVAGSPADWARLLHEIGSEGPAPLVRLLNWPLRKFPSNRGFFDAYLTKGGTFPGLVTEVSWVDPKGSPPPLAVALFLRNVPENVRAQLLDTYSHQLLMQRMAFSPGFLARVRRTL